MEDYDLESLLNYFQNFFKDKSKEDVVSMFWETYDCLLTGNQIYAEAIMSANQLVLDFLPVIELIEQINIETNDQSLSSGIYVLKEDLNSYLEKEKLCGLTNAGLSDIDYDSTINKVPEVTLDDIFR